MKTIICPTDFSACAQNAAMYAAQLAKEFNSRLILLHVYEIPLIYDEVPLVRDAEVDQSIQNRAKKNIDELKDKMVCDCKHLRVETLVMEGNPLDKIIYLADRESADLIIMGATGKSKTKRMLGGSTTSGVIDKANCPVLCIPSDEKFKGIRKIVFATDMHEDTMNAASVIVSFAKHFQAEIVFVYVDNKHLIHSEEGINEMTKKIRSLVHYPKMSGYIAKNTSITDGLEFFLVANPADLLVMFAHEKHFPKTLLNPSMTKKMTDLAPVPVLALTISDRTLAGVL
jgi:nucleotide-binding universal stress UspA family protein